MGDVTRMLKSAKAKKNVLIAAHRGTCGGNVVQNTTLAYENALQHGADMIEIDVIMSKDGKFFAFHDGQEKVVFGTNQKICEMTTKEIQERNCYNQAGDMTKQKIEKLEDILKHFENRCLINIDRSWFYWKEMIQFLNERDMQEQIILKSPPDEALLQQLERQGPNIMYMPILKDNEAWQRANQYNVNIVAVEIIFEKLDSPIIASDFMRGFHKSGILTWANAITLNDEVTLTGLLDDNHAILDGYDENWGKLVEMGFDIIQTDWPALLNQYILAKRKGE